MQPQEFLNKIIQNNAGFSVDLNKLNSLAAEVVAENMKESGTPHIDNNRMYDLMQECITPLNQHSNRFFLTNGGIPQGFNKNYGNHAVFVEIVKNRVRFISDNVPFSKNNRVLTINLNSLINVEFKGAWLLLETFHGKMTLELPSASVYQ